jgi:RHS repeat-associated protein
MEGDLQNVSTSWGEQVSYKHDRKGRLTDVTYGGAPLISDFKYRAWGAIKNVRYGNGRDLALEYDERLRLTRRDVDGVQGAEYGYDDFGESTGRVTRARDLYDRTLDRSYQYDHVGRLQVAASGQTARNQLSGASTTASDIDSGPYGQQYRYDVWGNLVEKTGRADEQSYRATYKNNQLQNDPLTSNEIKYDGAGNITNDGLQQFTYDAAGHQRRAKSQALDLNQDYDGNGLRVKKLEGNNTTYYVRSTVLGDQVVADLDGSGQVLRSYIYTGRQLIAVKDQAGLAWVLNDPVTKSKRMTNEKGRVISGIELDPWGNETGRSFETAQGKQQARRFTTYERDANGSDDAQNRRYNAGRGRFEQPDPFRGSTNPTDPQSLNRYSYTENDPVNHTDPSGLMMISCWDWGYSDGDSYGWACIGYDPWGGYNPDPPPPPDPPPCDPVFFDESQNFNIGGGTFTGADLNYAARVVYAEATGGNTKVNGSYLGDQVNAERDAIASVLYNRIGAEGFSGGVKTTFEGVANAPGQFASIGGAKLNGSGPGQYQNLQESKVNSRGQIYGGDCNDLRGSVDAIRRLINYGSQYDYTSFRGGTSGPGTVIGGSRFGYPETFQLET